MRVSWQVPGFAFLNTDSGRHSSTLAAASGEAVLLGRATALCSMSVGHSLSNSAANHFFLAVMPSTLGGRTTSSATKGKGWILAQPQFTWDLGAVFGAADQLLVGVEYQYWRNKLGVDEDDKRPPIAGDLAILTALFNEAPRR